MDDALKQTKGSFYIFKRYGDEGFNCSMDIAKEITEEMDIKPIFPTPHKDKRWFDVST
jgi:hypothetical protein